MFSNAKLKSKNLKTFVGPASECRKSLMSDVIMADLF